MGALEKRLRQAADLSNPLDIGHAANLMDEAADTLAAVREWAEVSHYMVPKPEGTNLSPPVVHSNGPCAACKVLAILDRSDSTE